MCELLGLAFNEPVTVSISLRAFQHRGAANPDGWGLAWFKDGQPEIRKEPASANRSRAVLDVLSKPNSFISNIFIGHVRYASCGTRTEQNTHPFWRDLHGTPIVFAHNGTLRDLPEPANLRPHGETDSERALCLFLSWMQKEGVAFSNFRRIEEWLRQLNRRGSMNLLFSNGSELFAYRDANEYKGLCFTYREAPFQVITLQDEDWTVDLSEVKKPSERGFVIATSPLTDENWTDLRPGALLVIQAGSAVYGDPRV
jgi:predicted glutamine amidotransferase